MRDHTKASFRTAEMQSRRGHLRALSRMMPQLKYSIDGLIGYGSTLSLNAFIISCVPLDLLSYDFVTVAYLP